MTAPSAPALDAIAYGRTSDGGHRGLSAEAAVERGLAHVDPVVGVLQQLSQIRHDPLPTFSVRHRLHRRPRLPADLRADTRRGSGGKGPSAVRATASALGEGFERVSGRWHAAVSHVTARADELDGRVILPNELSLFSARQMAMRTRTNRERSHLLHVADPFDPHRAVPWVRAWPLDGGGEPAWAPAASLYYDVPGADGTTDAHSNGTASGATLGDAVLQATHELIERDAISLWWYRQRRCAEVPLASVGSPAVDAFAQRLAGDGRRLHLLRLTTDLGIPVIAALSRRETGEPRWALGFGCHLDATVAASRAVTEVAQGLPAADEGHLPWEDRRPDPQAPLPHLEPIGRVTAPLPALSTGDTQADRRVLTDAFARAGLTAYWLDMTHPLVGIPVARVLVPGLAMFWRRLGAARLRDVPDAQGWTCAPFVERDVLPVDLVL